MRGKPKTKITRKTARRKAKQARVLVQALTARTAPAQPITIPGLRRLPSPAVPDILSRLGL